MSDRTPAAQSHFASGHLPHTGDSAMATIARRRQLLGTSSRSITTRSRMDTSDVTHETNESGDLIGEGGKMMQLEERLLVYLEHHGVRRCVDGALDNELLRNADTAKGAAASSSSGNTESVGRKPHYYMCVPCEQRLTSTLTRTATVDDIAAAVWHCSSAAHRMYARYMCLPDIDASLTLQPIPSPATNTTVTINGMRTLVCSMPGGSSMFQPPASFTEGAIQDVNEAFYRGVEPRDRRTKVSAETRRTFEIMKPRYVLKQLKDHEAANCENGADGSVVAPVKGKVFLYHPVESFVDPSMVYLPRQCIGRRRRADERGGWSAVPRGVLDPKLRVDYQFVNARSRSAADEAQQPSSSKSKTATSPRRVTVDEDGAYEVCLRCFVVTDREEASSLPRQSSQGVPFTAAAPLPSTGPLTQESLSLLQEELDAKYGLGGGTSNSHSRPASLFAMVHRFTAKRRREEGGQDSFHLDEGETTNDFDVMSAASSRR